MSFNKDNYNLGARIKGARMIAYMRGELEVKEGPRHKNTGDGNGMFQYRCQD